MGMRGVGKSPLPDKACINSMLCGPTFSTNNEPHTSLILLPFQPALFKPLDQLFLQESRSQEL